MLIVGNVSERVETDLSQGLVACPACEGVLRRWGFARRRTLRVEAGEMVVRPRRGRCRSCRSTHVLLPDVALLRRVDAVTVIGRALVAAAAGAGHRVIAEDLGRPASTVRGWLRRFRAAAARVAAHFLAWAHRFDPNLGAVAPAGGAAVDAVEAIGLAARAGSLRLGPRPAWSWASALTAGRLLSNTSSPWLAP